MSVSDRIGWGIVGLGRVADTAIAPAVAAAANSTLAGVVSRTAAKAEEFAARHGAPAAYDDYRTLLEDPSVDAVYIATPNALHADQVVAAAEAGKHVLCDKPMATSVEDARRQLAACEAADVQLGIVFHNRYLPWVRDVRRLLAEGAIGDVLTVQLEASAGHWPPEGWRNDPSLAGLGTVYNQGVHAYDALRYLLDAEPVAVSAMFDDEGGRYAIETTALSLIRFDNGVLASVNCNERSPHPQNDIAIFGTAGRIVGRNLTRSREDGELHVLTPDGETVTPYPSPGAHRLLLSAYARCVLAGEPVTPDGDDGLRSMLLCDAIARSAREGVTAPL
jgi:1,5-anhydro-D-fructose reductase (1,5-anhydro-D-mannitol-forming)